MQTRPCAILIASVLTLSSCVDDQTTIEFAGMCYPATPTAAGCSYAGSCTSLWMVGRIAADVGFTAIAAGGVTWPIEIDNLLLENSSESGQNNNNDAVIEAYELSYTSAGLSIPTATYRQTTFIPVNSTTVVEIMLMPPAIVAALAATITTQQPVDVKVRAMGYYTNGHAFKTGPFPVTVDVCNGCYTAPPACTTAGSSWAYCPREGQSAIAACIAN